MSLVVNDQKYIEEESLAADVTGDPIQLPKLVKKCVLSAFPGAGGTCKWQYTYSSHTDIDDSNASWLDWAAGAVASDADAYFEVAPNAVRLVSIGDTATGTVVGA